MLNLPELAEARVRLRALAQADVADHYVAWLTDPETTTFLEVSPAQVTRQSTSEWVAAMIDSPDDAVFAITVNGGHIGNIRLGPIDWKKREAPIGILIGSKEHWGKGFATECIALVASWAEADLGMTRLWAGMYSANVGSTNAFIRAGFSIESISPATRPETVLGDSVLVSRAKMQT